MKPLVKHFILFKMGSMTLHHLVSNSSLPQKAEAAEESKLDELSAAAVGDIGISSYYHNTWFIDVCEFKWFS